MKPSQHRTLTQWKEVKLAFNDERNAYDDDEVCKQLGAMITPSQ